MLRQQSTMPSSNSWPHPPSPSSSAQYNSCSDDYSRHNRTSVVDWYRGRHWPPALQPCHSCQCQYSTESSDPACSLLASAMVFLCSPAATATGSGTTRGCCLAAGSFVEFDRAVEGQCHWSAGRIAATAARGLVAEALVRWAFASCAPVTLVWRLGHFELAGGTTSAP